MGTAPARTGAEIKYEEIWIYCDPTAKREIKKENDIGCPVASLDLSSDHGSYSRLLHGLDLLGSCSS